MLINPVTEFVQGYPIRKEFEINGQKWYSHKVPLKDWEEFKKGRKIMKEKEVVPSSFPFFNVINEAALAERIDMIEGNGKKIAICLVNDHLQDVRQEIIEQIKSNIE